MLWQRIRDTTTHTQVRQNKSDVRAASALNERAASISASTVKCMVISLQPATQLPIAAVEVACGAVGWLDGGAGGC